MWKKKLIFVVTFLAGLYYFLEFVVPPTMPGRTSAGIVQTVNITDNQEGTASDVEIVLTAFKRSMTMPISENNEVTAIVDGVETRTTTPKLIATDVVVLANSERAVVTGKNRAQVKLGILGEPKTYRARVVDGKSNLLAYRVDASGGERQVDNPAALSQGDLVTKIGPSTYLSSVMTDANNFLIVLTALPWGFALFSLWFVHSGNIRKRKKEWYMSVLFFVGLGIGILGGSGYGLTAEAGNSFQAFRVFMNETVSQYIGFAFYSATFSILSFYLASAAYRSFKAKSREAVLMMVSALVVMLGQIPFGVYLTSWIPSKSAQLPVISQWLQLVLNTAAYRGMWFGIMLAMMAIGLRFWLSLERGAFFDREL